MSEELIKNIQIGHDNLVNRVVKIETVDLPAIKAKQEGDCGAIRKEMLDHNKRQDDATNTNTLALMSLTESITQNTIVYAGLIERLDKMEPVVNRSQQAITMWDRLLDWGAVNAIALRWIGKWVVAPIVTVAAVAGALRSLGII